MPAHPTEGNLDGPTQSAVVLELLDRSDPLTLAELHAAIRDVEDARIDAAVVSLDAAGVLRVEDDGLYATDALNRLDRLGMVTV